MKIKIIDRGMYHEPNRAHGNDVGADVYAPESVVLWPHETKKINLKFGIDLPAGYGAFIFPRSGLSSKGVSCELAPIDPLYTGDIHVIVTNHTDVKVTIEEGDRVGQLVVLPVAVVDFVTDLGDDRGSCGFGSTGK